MECVWELKAAAFDGDAQMDLLIVDKRSNIILLLGDGTGRFRSVRIVSELSIKAVLGWVSERFRSSGHVSSEHHRGTGP